jgi:carboxyl-terminal processing protease
MAGAGPGPKALDGESMYAWRPAPEVPNRVIPPNEPDALADAPAGGDADEPRSAEALDVPVAPVSRGGATESSETGRGRGRLPILPIAIAVVALLAGGALFMSGYSMGRQLADEPGTPVSEDEAFRPFWDTYHTITDRYVGSELDRDALIQGAIRGMIESLDDPYSSYLSSEEYRQNLQGISGEFEGIGAEISTQATDGSQGCGTLGPDCRLVIISPLAGSPAEAAGLLAGDLVLAVDGVPLDGQTVDGARDMIRGPKGSVVTLTVSRGDGEPLPLRITRDVIQLQEVETEEYADGTVGYVRLNSFSDRSAEDLAAALRSHIEAGRRKLILDLRSNPGGYVTAARSVASQFVASGPVFWEETASGAQTPSEALPDGAATDESIEVICLVDGGSASASEIVAGALQDTGRATLVGQTTFGKGTVQQWQELTGEGGAFRLTVAKWLTPNKRWIHNVGLEPDVPVTIPDDITPGDDPTLDRALALFDASASRDAQSRIAA